MKSKLNLCPHCGEPAMSILRKCLYPRGICIACGQKVTVSQWYILTVLMILIIPTLDSYLSGNRHWWLVLILGLVVGNIAVLFTQPLVKKGK